MMSQVLSNQSTGVRVFAALLRAHASSTRVLNQQLLADHGLTLSDYEVLLRLAWSEDRRMRRVDLAEEVLLTASGITRLLDGLEKAGYVERGTCDSDRRVVYAVLTEPGLAKLREASTTHVAQVEELFAERFDARELETVGELLSRLGGTDSRDCAPDAET
jgi:DNA-binding MarR family transcriptional regulator